jgi:hypothetical protein
MNRLPTECRHSRASALGHTLPVGVLNNGETGVFRTQENRLQQKKNQVAKRQNDRRNTQIYESLLAILGKIAGEKNRPL